MSFDEVLGATVHGGCVCPRRRSPKAMAGEKLLLDTLRES